MGNTRRLLMVGGLTIVSMVTTLGVAAPAQAVPGLVFVSATSPTGHNLGYTVVAACPSGLRVLGGGGSTWASAPPPSVAVGAMIDSMKPVTTAAGDSFEVTASIAPAPGGPIAYPNWTVLSYAICGPAPAGLEYVSAVSPTDLSTSKTATATCSLGKRVIGTGAHVGPAFGFMAVDAILPHTTLTNVRVNAFQGEVPPGFAWNVTAFAVCANPLPGLTLVSALTPSTSLDKTVGVTCPAGKKVHGLGSDLANVNGQAAPSRLFPNQELTSVSLTAREDHTGVPGNWWARVYAICAT